MARALRVILRGRSLRSTGADAVARAWTSRFPPTAHFQAWLALAQKHNGVWGECDCSYFHDDTEHTVACVRLVRSRRTS